MRFSLSSVWRFNFETWFVTLVFTSSCGKRKHVQHDHTIQSTKTRKLTNIWFTFNCTDLCLIFSKISSRWLSKFVASSLADSSTCKTVINMEAVAELFCHWWTCLRWSWKYICTTYLFKKFFRETTPFLSQNNFIFYSFS